MAQSAIGQGSGAAAVQVARAIEQEIRDNDWEPGHFIGRRQEIQARFQVAPATLGEAIQLLRSRGRIDARPGPGGGIFVAEGSPFTTLSDQLLSLREGSVTLSDCHRVLDALDGAVMADAVEFATDEDIRDLRHHAERLRAEWAGPHVSAEIWALHARIARISRNELLRSLYLNRVDYITAGFAGADTLAPASPDRLDIHLEMVAAIEARDQARAGRVVARHSKSSAYARP